MVIRGTDFASGRAGSAPVDTVLRARRELPEAAVPTRPPVTPGADGSGQLVRTGSRAARNADLPRVKAWAMGYRSGLVFGVVTVSAGFCFAAGFLPHAGTRATPGADCYRVQSERFDFHSDPWINLHHFLFQWARASSEARPGDIRPPVKVPEMEQLRALTAGERQA